MQLRNYWTDSPLVLCFPVFRNWNCTPVACYHTSNTHMSSKIMRKLGQIHRNNNHDNHNRRYNRQISVKAVTASQSHKVVKSQKVFILATDWIFYTAPWVSVFSKYLINTWVMPKAPWILWSLREIRRKHSLYRPYYVLCVVWLCLVQLFCKVKLL